MNVPPPTKIRPLAVYKNPIREDLKIFLPETENFFIFHPLSSFNLAAAPSWIKRQSRLLPRERIKTVEFALNFIWGETNYRELAVFKLRSGSIGLKGGGWFSPRWKGFIHRLHGMAIFAILVFAVWNWWKAFWRILQYSNHDHLCWSENSKSSYYFSVPNHHPTNPVTLFDSRKMTCNAIAPTTVSVDRKTNRGRVTNYTETSTLPNGAIISRITAATTHRIMRNQQGVCVCESVSKQKPLQNSIWRD